MRLSARNPIALKNVTSGCDISLGESKLMMRLFGCADDRGWLYLCTIRLKSIWRSRPSSNLPDHLAPIKLSESSFSDQFHARLVTRCHIQQELAFGPPPSSSLKLDGVAFPRWIERFSLIAFSDYGIIRRNMMAGSGRCCLRHGNGREQSKSRVGIASTVTSTLANQCNPNSLEHAQE